MPVFWSAYASLIAVRSGAVALSTPSRPRPPGRERLAGIAVDEVGAPLDGVAVTLCPGPVTATTTTAGFFAFDRLHLVIARSATHYGRIDAIRVGPIQHFELRDGRLVRAEP